MSNLNINMITIPDYENLTVEVKIKSPERDHLDLSNDIHSVEKSYITKRDETEIAQEKECYDRARAVCKWADSCGARIKSQKIEQGNLHFKFSFSSLEQLKEFNENASININGATTKAEAYEQKNENKNRMRINLITRPDYHNLSSMVVVPYPEQDQIIMSGNIQSAEKGYILKRERAQSAQAKECYDRARAVCKWAESCGATLKTQRVQDGYLQISISFQSQEQLKEFEDNARININGATLKTEDFENNKKSLNEMLENVNTKPNYTDLTTTVSVPYPEQDQIIMSENIHAAEESFITRRDGTEDSQKKEMFDRARAACKWASSCGGKLKTQRVQGGQLNISFSFSTPEQLKEFEEFAKANISGATMTAENFEQQNGRNI